MSEQPLNLRWSLRTLWRRRTVVGIVTAAGLLAGAAYAGTVNQPLHAATALVVLPAATTNMTTAIAVATSAPVLENAEASVRPAASSQTLRSRIHVTSMGSILQITAQSGSVIQAESMANAVAGSYVAYVGSANTPVGQVMAQVAAPARTATAADLPVRMAANAILGALAGLVIGAVGALAAGRRSRRLWQRDEIADAIGVPVLASMPVPRARGAAAWVKLLDDYQPADADRWRLRRTLDELGRGNHGQEDPVRAITVISLANDRRALALGPQLCAAAAACKIPVTLVIGPQQDAKAVAALHHAAVTPPPSRRPGQLRLSATDNNNIAPDPDSALSVAVAIVDGQSPQVVSAIHSGATVLAVSAGAATSDELARVAAVAAASGHAITGILVADPDPADPTTGQLPELARPAGAGMPTRLTGTLH